MRRALAARERLGLHAETDRVDGVLARGGVTVTNDRSVDPLASLRGPPFSQLWRRRIAVRIPGARIPVVSRRDQIRLLRAAGRVKDLEDAEALESLEGD